MIAGRPAIMLTAGLLGLLARPAAAQCPDGSPPPCARPAARPDPNRVAILPFRVSSTDTLLGEGLAELLALEFAGDVGPRAVNMGTVLSAWRGAGGGLRSPLPLPRALRVAAGVGAGRLVEGSIVGLGTRLTVAASVVSVPGGTVTQVESVTGHADSLDGLLGRLAVAVLTAASGEARLSGTGRAGRLTESPRALRAYMEGLRAWRRRGYERAVAALDRAVADDSTFADAAYLRLLTGRYRGEDVERWERLAWAYQDRLAGQDRVVLRAILGPSYPAARTLDAELADLEDAVRRAPESPVAHFELGDLLLHAGGAAGIPGATARARAQLERSLALDTLSTTMSHLLAAVMAEGDTASLRRVWAAYEAFLGSNTDWRPAWLVAGVTGDRRVLESLRRRRAGVSLYLYNAGALGISAALTDEMLAHTAYDAPGDERGVLGYVHSALVQGRPGAARRAAESLTGPRSAPVRDALLILGAVVSDGDTSAAAAADARLDDAAGLSPAMRARAQCARTLWALSRGRPAEWDGELLRREGQLNCAIMLELLRAWRSGAPDLDARLAQADSTVRERYAFAGYAGFENLVLVWIWESRGATARALAAARRVNTGFVFTHLTTATSARHEGRLAAQLGDTTGAIRAYRSYLALRRDAEPALVPQRDSVQAELARLESRR